MSEKSSHPIRWNHHWNHLLVLILRGTRLGTHVAMAFFRWKKIEKGVLQLRFPSDMGTGGQGKRSIFLLQNGHGLPNMQLLVCVCDRQVTLVFSHAGRPPGLGAKKACFSHPEFLDVSHAFLDWAKKLVVSTKCGRFLSFWAPSNLRK